MSGSTLCTRFASLRSVENIFLILFFSEYETRFSLVLLTFAPVQQFFQEKLGINLHCVDAKDRFLTLLDGCTEPEAKRKIIGKTFIHVFQVRFNDAS